MITIKGKKVSDGIAIGRLSFSRRDMKEVRRIYVKDAEKEVQRFERAKEKAQADLQDLCEATASEVGEVNAAIFEMELRILSDQLFLDTITNVIVEEKLNAEYAVEEGTERFLRLCKEEDRGYNASHEADIRDVSLRLIRVLSRSWKDRLLADEPYIMAAEELYPSDVIKMDKSKVKGFVTMYGTINSHAAVLARTRGIPAVVGLGDALKEEYDGKMIIVDGSSGKVYVDPDSATLNRMRRKQDENKTQVQNLERLRGKENTTQGGQKIDVYANIGSREDIDSVVRSDAGGIGLFRSEFLYMENGGKLPTEEQQYQTYLLAAEAMGTKPVVIRTADLGGDKQIPFLNSQEEKNPAMGMRGIRISLEKQEMFETQLRAILRAAVNGNVAVMFPMVTSIDEVRRAKILLDRAKNELKEEKAIFKEEIPVGVMIETPAAVMISGELAREVDFLSIGTNDLTQFTLGMDRTDPELEGFYDTNHPGLLKMIRVVVNNAHLEGKRVSICGDMAADLSRTKFFLEVGADALSVAPADVLELRKKIREI